MILYFTHDCYSHSTISSNWHSIKSVGSKGHNNEAAFDPSMTFSDHSSFKCSRPWLHVLIRRSYKKISHSRMQLNHTGMICFKHFIWIWVTLFYKAYHRTRSQTLCALKTLLPELYMNFKYIEGDVTPVLRDLHWLLPVPLRSIFNNSFLQFLVVHWNSPAYFI